MSNELEQLIDAAPRGVQLQPGHVRIKLNGPDAANLGEVIAMLSKLVTHRQACAEGDKARAEEARKVAERAQRRAEEKAHEEKERREAIAQAEATKKPEAPPPEAVTEHDRDNLQGPPEGDAAP